MEEKRGTLIEVESLLLLGRDAIERGAYVEALTLIHGIIYQFPQSGPAYNLRGWLYANVFDNLKEAVESYRLALELSPSHRPTYLNYAVLLNQLERFDELTQLLNKALQVEGIDKVQIHHDFGIMYEKQGKYDDAAAAYLEAVRHTLKAEEVVYFNDAVNRCRLKQEVLASPYRSGDRPFFSIDAQRVIGAEKRIASSS